MLSGALKELSATPPHIIFPDAWNPIGIWQSFPFLCSGFWGRVRQLFWSPMNIKERENEEANPRGRIPAPCQVYEQGMISLFWTINELSLWGWDNNKDTCVDIKVRTQRLSFSLCVWFSMTPIIHIGAHAQRFWVRIKPLWRLDSNFYRINILLPYDPDNPLLDIHSTEMSAYVH